MCRLERGSYLWLRAILQEELNRGPSAANTLKALVQKGRLGGTPQHPSHKLSLTVQETESWRRKVNGPGSHGKVME